MQFNLYILVFFLISNCSMYQEKTLFAEVEFYFSCLHPELNRFSNDKLESNHSIIKFDKIKSRYTLYFLGSIAKNEEKSMMKAKEFNTIAKKYNRLFHNFNKQNFLEISPYLVASSDDIPQSNEDKENHKTIPCLMEAILSDINKTNNDYFFLSHTSFEENINKHVDYTHMQSNFIQKRLSAIDLSKEIYNNLFEEEKYNKYNKIKEDYQSLTLLAVNDLLEEDDFNLLKKILVESNNLEKKEYNNVVRILQYYQEVIRSKLHNKKDDIIGFCIQNNITKIEILNIIFDEKTVEEIAKIKNYDIPKEFLEVDILQAKKTHSEEAIMKALKECTCNLTIDNVDKYVKKLNDILKECNFLEEDNNLHSLLNIFFKWGKKISNPLFYSFLVAISKYHCLYKKQIQEYFIKKHPFPVSDNELVITRYADLIPLVWNELLSKAHNNKIKHYNNIKHDDIIEDRNNIENLLILLQKHNKLEDKHFLEYIREFPIQKKNFIQKLFKLEKYKNILIKLLSIKKDVNEGNIEDIQKEETSYNELLNDFQRLKKNISEEKKQHENNKKKLEDLKTSEIEVDNDMRVEIGAKKACLQFIYQTYINHFLYQYYLNSFDIKNEINFKSFEAMRNDDFKILLNQKIDFNRILKYILLLEGNDRENLIPNFLNFVFNNYQKDNY